MLDILLKKAIQNVSPQVFFILGTFPVPHQLLCPSPVTKLFQPDIFPAGRWTPPPRARFGDFWGWLWPPRRNSSGTVAARQPRHQRSGIGNFFYFLIYFLFYFFLCSDEPSRGTSRIATSGFLPPSQKLVGSGATQRCRGSSRAVAMAKCTCGWSEAHPQLQTRAPHPGASLTSHLLISSLTSSPHRVALCSWRVGTCQQHEDSHSAMQHGKALFPWQKCIASLHPF